MGVRQASKDIPIVTKPFTSPELPFAVGREERRAECTALPGMPPFPFTAHPAAGELDISAMTLVHLLPRSSSEIKSRGMREQPGRQRTSSVGLFFQPQMQLAHSSLPVCACAPSADSLLPGLGPGPPGVRLAPENTFHLWRGHLLGEIPMFRYLIALYS